MSEPASPFRMVMAIALVGAIATLLLGLADIVTREPIEEAKRLALHRALEQVLPRHVDHPVDQTRDTILITDGDNEVLVYRARSSGGEVIAAAWEQEAPDGYTGAIYFLMGVMRDGSVTGIRVTDHRETPGLGDGIDKDIPWLESFIGGTLKKTNWAVKKDGGSFDQFTGATITPRAVVKAVKRGLEFYERHSAQILDGKSNKAQSQNDE